eukprot:7376750-Prymnesium_polylepis.1
MPAASAILCRRSASEPETSAVVPSGLNWIAMRCGTCSSSAFASSLIEWGGSFRAAARAFSSASSSARAPGFSSVGNFAKSPRKAGAARVGCSARISSGAATARQMSRTLSAQRHARAPSHSPARSPAAANQPASWTSRLPPCLPPPHSMRCIQCIADCSRLAWSPAAQSPVSVRPVTNAIRSHKSVRSARTWLLVPFGLHCSPTLIVVGRFEPEMDEARGRSLASRRPTDEARASIDERRRTAPGATDKARTGRRGSPG